MVRLVHGYYNFPIKLFFRRPSANVVVVVYPGVLEQFVEEKRAEEMASRVLFWFTPFALAATEDTEREVDALVV